jgi:MOSC domain-containing protein YiiM
MRPLEEADLTEGGIPGDRHFAPESSRQLLLIDAETLASFDLVAGQVRENFTLAGIPVMSLDPGTRLAVGDAEVLITMVCNPCSRMDEIRPGLQVALEGHRGMLATVVRPGRVRRGDAVRIVVSEDLAPEPAAR